MQSNEAAIIIATVIPPKIMRAFLDVFPRVFGGKGDGEGLPESLDLHKGQVE
ncbi:MAG TPA: hypothetical protein OIM20_06795 [Eggerthellaceae bacterium]|nr:hypothetical protein [Eggerthellaceae bacterium]